MIEASGLSRRYGDFVAVDDVSFRIETGEVVGLLGHNGAGKTTIMKMLTGYIEPSSGHVSVDGVDVAQDPLQVQTWMGYLPENLPLYPEFSVVDYLAHAAQLRGLDPQNCVRRAIEATQLQVKALDSINTLSRGYKQRVGVAQAILHSPKFLILDEPTNGLDPSQILEMRNLIRGLSESATVILSTHILQEVDAVCDRALILRNGQLVVDERLDALHKTTHLQLATDAQVDVQNTLSGLPSIGECASSGEGRWQLEVVGSVEQGAAAVAKALVDHDIPVYELLPLVRDLETVFKDVNESMQDQSNAA